MKANSTQCSQASLPLIQRAFLYKVKEKKKTNIKRQPVVCLEKETRHFVLTYSMLFDSVLVGLRVPLAVQYMNIYP